MLTKLEAERRVANGIAYLNRTEPGWVRRIDLEIFDLTSPCNCVLGQLFGRMSNHAVETDDGMPVLLDGSCACDCGFDCRGDDELSLAEDIEPVWIAAIRALQHPVELPAVRSHQPVGEYAIAK